MKSLIVLAFLSVGCCQVRLVPVDERCFEEGVYDKSIGWDDLDCQNLEIE